jgi:hypothetical protein
MHDSERSFAMMPSVPLSRRRFVLGGAALALTGCGSLALGEGGPPVEAPSYRVGDRWVYSAWDGYYTPVRWEETWEVIAVGPQGIDARVTQEGPTIHTMRTEHWSAPGKVTRGALYDDETRLFKGDLLRYDFPLAQGKTWNQWLDNFNEATNKEGRINRYGSVGGWRKIATPAGDFDAVALRVYMHLDDDEFWRERSDCTYLLWYAPAVRATVREVKMAEYREKSGKHDTPPYRTQNAVLELLSFSAGA